MSRETNRFVKQLKGSPIRNFDAAISDVKDLIRFTMGEPDFDTPDFIKAAAADALNQNQTHYAPSAGVLETRKEIAKFMERKYGLHYNAETDIILTVGATEAITASMFALMNPGDKVIIQSPAFPQYEYVTHLAGGQSVKIDTSETGFLITPEDLMAALDANPETKMVVLTYPNNPTGATYTKAEVEALAEVIRKYDVFVLSDEIYSELTYDGSHTSIAKYIPEQSIVINGTSKSYAMTGWRVGFVAAQADLIREILKYHQSLVTCGSTPAQTAAGVAFRDGDEATATMKAAYLKRRDILLEGLTAAGLKMNNPDGAFYLFPRIPEQYGNDDWNFCIDLARKAGVGVIPGSAFGESGVGYFRMSYAASDENVIEGCRRIVAFLDELNAK
ncbi:aminotransferase class I/II-fold pyridoxal phosphate-dependent enzyme [Trichococcus shcherbakoviae]|uniref:aminotransferase class I/II-fold pyridoxal phosphate-dependent enzyme n=1 Tax=Trichococcus shcherbakoviae TaxID=2094020 RepID=UPI0029F5C129|nr:aminotransferase class I/II-fold pyridoxal phosphate-dependent enzyme [Trichococcus shcherbakoviae]